MDGPWDIRVVVVVCTCNRHADAKEDEEGEEVVGVSVSGER